jgi:hypothetical protein
MVAHSGILNNAASTVRSQHVFCSRSLLVRLADCAQMDK